MQDMPLKKRNEDKTKRRRLEINNRKTVETIIREHGFSDYRWIKSENIVVAHWVRFKCIFGCTSYGRKGTCPPQVPAVEECRAFFNDYSEAVILRFAHRVDRPEDRVDWSRGISEKLIALERQVFLNGFHKAFMLFMDECRMCSKCTGSREECVRKEVARPGPESLAVDVFSTVRSVGYPIEVLTDYGCEMNRYAFLMVE